jgi:antitoxin component YwqK of YwqJK toxin-antitoxin module
MKRALTVLGILICSFSSSGQNLFDQEFYLKGDTVLTIPNPIVSYELDTIDSMIQGPYKVFDEQLRLRAEVNFKDGQEVGTARIYSRKGKLVMLLFYVHGEIQYRMQFYLNGKVWKVDEIKNGFPHGKSVTFWRNGSVMSERTFQNGKEIEPYVRYYRNGKVEHKLIEKNGEVISTWYHRNGKPREYR